MFHTIVVDHSYAFYSINFKSFSRICIHDKISEKIIVHIIIFQDKNPKKSISVRLLSHVCFGSDNGLVPPPKLKLKFFCPCQFSSSDINSGGPELFQSSKSLKSRIIVIELPINWAGTKNVHKK